jgi:hypothetical protein
LIIFLCRLADYWSLMQKSKDTQEHGDDHLLSYAATLDEVAFPPVEAI